MWQWAAEFPFLFFFLALLAILIVPICVASCVQETIKLFFHLTDRKPKVLNESVRDAGGKT